ncbi:hypothetical protein [Bradyrhizobium liaoningense]|uniref:hypothetical protein n=1 Tax=Bradyrhizobium liaoningense TaxID=43992 RepID=UPI001BA56569|nr:hypothetical protein [Bradyrhizobium liaoningense]
MESSTPKKKRQTKNLQAISIYKLLSTGIVRTNDEGKAVYSDGYSDKIVAEKLNVTLNAVISVRRDEYGVLAARADRPRRAKRADLEATLLQLMAEQGAALDRRISDIREGIDRRLNEIEAGGEKRYLDVSGQFSDFKQRFDRSCMAVTAKTPADLSALVYNPLMRDFKR